MLKPRANFIVVEIKEKKLKSGLILPDSEDSSVSRDIVVKEVGPDVEDLKKGDKIVLRPGSKAVRVSGNEGEGEIVYADDVIATL